MIRQIARSEPRQWMAERVGWCIMGGVILLALIGTFGNGLLSRRKIQTEDGTVTLAYDQFVRTHAPCDMVLELAPPQSETMHVSISQNWLAKFQIEEIQPAPISADTNAEAVTFHFHCGDTSQVCTLRWRLKPQQPGFVSGMIRVRSRPDLPFKQFIYP